MSGKILQINFKFNVPVSDYIEAVAPLARREVVLRRRGGAA